MSHTLELTEQEAAQAARQLIRQENIGTFISLNHNSTKKQPGHDVPHLSDSKLDKEFEGWPFGIVDYYVDLPGESGCPVLFISSLQKSFHNFEKDNRVSLTVRAPVTQGTAMTNARVTLMGSVHELDYCKLERAKEAYFKAHPDARIWMNFRDFKFYQLHVQRVYWVGGFGGIHYIGFVNPEWYSEVEEKHLVNNGFWFVRPEGILIGKKMLLFVIISLLFFLCTIISLLIYHRTHLKSGHGNIVLKLE